MPRTSPRLHLESLEDRLAPATLPIGFSESAIVSGLTRPTAMEAAPDGKLFILEQAGTAEVWQNGLQVSANFFDGSTLTPAVVDDQGERGLLGLAFDPNYASNRFLYVYYTVDGSTSHNRLSRFTADTAGSQVVTTSEQVVLELPNLSTATNHNGGAIHFDLDGKLYVAVGDNANGLLAPSLGSLFGKILRLNVSGGSLIPGDNPFVATPGARGEIWALGLRNPYTFDVHSATGGIFVNDVGQSAWEEINPLARGANYGWPFTEGPFNPASFPGFTNPVLAYPHPGIVPGAPITGFAVTGGAFYDPATNLFPTDYGAGEYFFADFISGFIEALDTQTGQVRHFAGGVNRPVDLDVTPDGKLLYLSFAEGKVYSVSFTVPASGLLPDGSVGTPEQRYVAALYKDILGRPITVAEIQAGVLTGHAGSVALLGRIGFADALQRSDEARIRLIANRYLDFLERPVDTIGLGLWLNFMRAGATIEEVELGLLSSPEYQLIHGNDLSRIVDALYDDVLGRAPDAVGKAFWLGLAQSGQSTLSQVVVGLLHSQEHRNRLVNGWYNAYLLRPAGPAGLAAWVPALNAGFRDETVLAMILGDPGQEYFNRVVL